MASRMRAFSSLRQLFILARLRFSMIGLLLWKKNKKNHVLKKKLTNQTQTNLLFPGPKRIEKKKLINISNNLRDLEVWLFYFFLFLNYKLNRKFFAVI